MRKKENVVFAILYQKNNGGDDKKEKSRNKNCSMEKRGDGWCAFRLLCAHQERYLTLTIENEFASSASHLCCALFSGMKL